MLLALSKKVVAIRHIFGESEQHRMLLFVSMICADTFVFCGCFQAVSKKKLLQSFANKQEWYSFNRCRWMQKWWTHLIVVTDKDFFFSHFLTSAIHVIICSPPTQPPHWVFVFCLIWKGGQITHIAMYNKKLTMHQMSYNLDIYWQSEMQDRTRLLLSIYLMKPV